MAYNCAVVGCESTSNPFSSVTFYRVTKNKRILPFWLKAVDLKLTDDAQICSLHFKTEDLLDGKNGKRLRWDAVPCFNVNKDSEDNEPDDDTCDEDEEDNQNLSLLKKQLESDNNTGPSVNESDGSINDTHPQKFEMVIARCNSKTCSSKKPAGSKQSKQMSNVSIQANRITEREVLLRQKVKLLGSRLKRREAKISYMKTVLNMVKKHVKGTDMEYKLSCELQNIYEFSDTIKSEEKTIKNKRQANTSPVSDHYSNNEESSGDENGVCVEVTLSPNLRHLNGVQ